MNIISLVGGPPQSGLVRLGSFQELGGGGGGEVNGMCLQRVTLPIRLQLVPASREVPPPPDVGPEVVPPSPRVGDGSAGDCAKAKGKMNSSKKILIVSNRANGQINYEH